MSILDDIWDSDDNVIDIQEEQRKNIYRDFSKGSGNKTDEEKTYNKWLRYNRNEKALTAKEFTDETFVESGELEHVLFEIYCTAEYFNIEFDEAIIISDSKYIAYVQGHEINNRGEWITAGEKQTKRWKLAKKVINNAFNETPTKLQNAVDTLLSINVEIPIELEKSIWVQKNYAKNQKVNALIDAINSIFPDIKHKPTIEIIARKALN